MYFEECGYIYQNLVYYIYTVKTHIYFFKSISEFT